MIDYGAVHSVVYVSGCTRHATTLFGSKTRPGAPTPSRRCAKTAQLCVVWASGTARTHACYGSPFPTNWAGQQRHPTVLRAEAAEEAWVRVPHAAIHSCTVGKLKWKMVPLIHSSPVKKHTSLYLAFLPVPLTVRRGVPLPSLEI